MALGQNYSKQLRRQFTGLHANFPPNRPLALGDYGILRDDVFQRLGNIKQLNIAFQAIDGIAQSDFQFKTEGSVNVDFVAKGEAMPGGTPAVRAGLEIHFSSQDAIFFNASGCTVTQIDDVASAGTALIELLNQGRWESDYYVVTSMVKAARTTALASAGSSAEVKLEAKSDALPEIDLADAGLELRVRRSRSTSLEMVTSKEQTPLMQLSRIRGLFRNQFGPEAVNAGPAAHPFAFEPDETSPFIKRAAAGRVAQPALDIPAAAEPRVEAVRSDFELDRAKKVYIPLLEASYALANQQPVTLPPGCRSLAEIRADMTEMVEAPQAADPRVADALRNDTEAVASIADPSAFGFVVLEEATGAVIVSIRGTQTPREWLADFIAIPNPFNEAPGFGLVHLGFERMYRSVRSSVQQALASVGPNLRITVLGHSLGGAMAILAAVDIKRNMGKTNVDACTFGGPRTGKLDFRANFNRLITRCYRVTNLFDIVPHVPSLVTGWAHVGEEVEVNGNVDHPHSLLSYMEGLRNIGQPLEMPAAGPQPEMAMPAPAGVLSMRTQ